MTGNPAESAIRKASRRLIPFLVLCYAVNFLDRVNVGFAALAMNEDLGFTPEVFGFGAGIFFAGYILFEVPSNLALARFGARIWIARIMISWGLVATAMGFVAGETSFYALRFALGARRAEVVRLLLMERFGLAILGTLVGALLSVGLMRALTVLSLPGAGRLDLAQVRQLDCWLAGRLRRAAISTARYLTWPCSRTSRGCCWWKCARASALTGSVGSRIC